MDLKLTKFQPIADVVNLIYSGDPKGLIDDLYLNLYLLHQVDHEAVQKDEMDRVVYLLKSLTDGFRAVIDD